MSLSNSKVNELLKVVSSEFNIEMNELCKKIEDIWTPEGRWGSAAAKKLAKKHKISLSDIIATGEDGRILEKDVKKAAGIPLQKKKKLGPFVSQRALDLAREHGLHVNTLENFPRKKRSGKGKGGKKKITLADVRKVAGIDSEGKKISSFASEAAEKLAKKYKISPEDIKEKSGTNGKILKSDVEYHIELTSGNASDSESEIEDSDSESDQDTHMEIEE